MEKTLAIGGMMIFFLFFLMAFVIDTQFAWGGLAGLAVSAFGYVFMEK